MNLAEIINDIAANAPVDRAGNWLLLASKEHPDLFSALTDNLNAPPSTVITKLSAKYPLACVLTFMPTAEQWIAQLQQWFKERKDLL